MDVQSFLAHTYSICLGQFSQTHIKKQSTRLIQTNIKTNNIGLPCALEKRIEKRIILRLYLQVLGQWNLTCATFTAPPLHCGWPERHDVAPSRGV